ncbi:MAG: nickel-dependent hydrogenase large subunit [Firmicutes bacterium]|nr:nickel-dependent hydrogenase large subunit [Bacillota bacterium]
MTQGAGAMIHGAKDGLEPRQGPLSAVLPAEPATAARRRVRVDYVARVEGEAALDLEIEDGKLTRLVLDIFEPPRFFQAFLKGRHFTEVPEITSRICGICPVAHQLTAIQALEAALGVTVPEPVRVLRHLLAISQILQSHVLHIYMLALPDFLGYESVLAMAQDHAEVVNRALHMKRLGNDFTEFVGGRAVHPVTAVIGGFTRWPDPAEAAAMRRRLEASWDDLLATARLVQGLSRPAHLPPPQAYEMAALRAEQGYAIQEGRWHSTGGLDTAPADYRQHVEEHHVPPSHALHSRIRGRGPFIVGPLARLNLNRDRLNAWGQAMLDECGLQLPSQDMFDSIKARVVELGQLIRDALDLLAEFPAPPRPVPVPVRAGEGAAITEAPRGSLYHAYAVNARGFIEKADIVAPTSHNAASMEQELRDSAPALVNLPDEEIRRISEMMIRNYDPCFSCSVHCVKVRIRRHSARER